MKYHISAFYVMPDGTTVERRLRKNGSVAQFDSAEIAIETARAMFPLLPKAREVAVFKMSGGEALKSFSRPVAIRR